MMPRRKPDHEAESVRVKANEIDDPKPFVRSKTHGGNRSVAKGNIEIRIVKQHPGTGDKEKRPERGAVLEGPGKDSEITIESRRIEKHGRSKDGTGREAATASMGVGIFGRLRRAKK